MLKITNRIMSIISLFIFALFTVYSGYILYKNIQYCCMKVIMFDDGSFGGIYEFSPQAIVFIISAAIILLALISHILKLIMSKKLVFSIICTVISELSLLFFLKLNTTLAEFMFFRYVLHIINPLYTDIFVIIKPIIVLLVFVLEIISLILAVLFQEKAKQETIQKA